MSKKEESFFDYDLTLEGGLDEDKEYDALNDETFGAGIETEWEADHERESNKLENSAEYWENYESDKLSEEVARFILDDEIEEPSNTKHMQIDEKQPHARANCTFNQRTTSGPRVNNSYPMDRSKPTKLLTVAEIEAKMKMDAKCSSGHYNYEPNNAKTNRDMAGYYNLQPHSRGPHTRHRYPHANQQLMHETQYTYSSNDGRYYGVRHPSLPRFQYLPIPLLGDTSRYQGPRFRPHHDHRVQFLSRGAGRLSNLLPHNREGISCNQEPMLYPMASTSQPRDQYAGLMSLHEKQWLASIQLMTLTTNQPLLDDYYFIMLGQKQQGNAQRKFTNFQVKNRETSKPTTTYTPLQFENSLGKLQAGSVTAPRKIIDMDVVETATMDQHTKTEKKTKQNLIEIEQMYNLVLKIEEACNPLFNPDAGPNKNNLATMGIEGVPDIMQNTLLVDKKLATIMSIRKGKKLVLRLLYHLTNPDPIVHQLLLDLKQINRKDNEQILLSFLPFIRSYLSIANLQVIVEVLQKYESSFLFSNKFATSVMANLVERADQVIVECTDFVVVEAYKTELSRLVKAAEHVTKEEDRPVVAVDRQVLIQHLALINLTGQDDFTAIIRVLGSLCPRTLSETATA